MGLFEIKLVGLAKSRTRNHFSNSKVNQSAERIVVPIFSMESNLEPESLNFETRVLRVGSPEFRLVTQLRDEAHRFAIGFHRKRRSAKAMASLLDGIPGLGPKRKAQLLKVFDDPKQILSCEEKTLCEKTGFPVDFVRKLVESLKLKLGSIQ
jgi:excinuclease ABC subunit C